MNLFSIFNKITYKESFAFSEDSTCNIFRTLLTLEAPSLAFLLVYPYHRASSRWPVIHIGFIEIGHLFQELWEKKADSVWGHLYNELYLD
jgi:hypothetical protein